jgi:hypothetical protein
MKLEECEINKIVLVKSKSLQITKEFTYENFLSKSLFGLGKIMEIQEEGGIVIVIPINPFSVEKKFIDGYYFLPEDLEETK